MDRVFFVFTLSFIAFVLSVPIGTMAYGKDGLDLCFQSVFIRVPALH